MMTLNMFTQESAKTYLADLLDPFGHLWIMARDSFFDQLDMAFKDLLALAARYAGGWSALLAGRQGLLDTSMPKVPRSTADS